MNDDRPIRGAPFPHHPGDSSNGSAASHADEEFEPAQTGSVETNPGPGIDFPPPERHRPDPDKPMDPATTGGTDPGNAADPDFPPPTGS